MGPEDRNYFIRHLCSLRYSGLQPKSLSFLKKIIASRLFPLSMRDIRTFMDRSWATLWEADTLLWMTVDNHCLCLPTAWFNLAKVEMSRMEREACSSPLLAEWLMGGNVPQRISEAAVGALGKMRETIYCERNRKQDTAERSWRTWKANAGNWCVKEEADPKLPVSRLMDSAEKGLRRSYGIECEAFTKFMLHPAIISKY